MNLVVMMKTVSILVANNTDQMMTMEAVVIMEAVVMTDDERNGPVAAISERQLGMWQRHWLYYASQ